MTPMDQHVATVSFPIVAATWGTFFGIALVSFCLQLRAGRQTLSPSSLFRFIFPHEGWSTTSSKLDIVMYFAKKVIDKLLPISFVFVTLTLSGLVGGLLHLAFPSHVQMGIGFLGIVACSVIMFLAVDLANYVSHAWEHYVPALWELHKVHHSATFLQPTTTARVHPLETLFDGLLAAIFMSLPIGTFIFLYDLTFLDGLVLVANANLIGTIAVLDVLRHSHFPISFGHLDRLLLSPHMHQAHHSVARRHWDRNFGNKLSIWDWLFGTAIKPAPGEGFVYGLGTPEDADFERLSGLYLLPLVKMARLARETRFRSMMMRDGARFFRRRPRRRPSRPAQEARQAPLRPVDPAEGGAEAAPGVSRPCPAFE